MANVIDINLEENKITQALMGYFLRIHKQMGPGLLESVYEECLCHILQTRKRLPLRLARRAHLKGCVYRLRVKCR